MIKSVMHDVRAPLSAFSYLSRLFSDDGITLERRERLFQELASMTAESTLLLKNISRVLSEEGPIRERVVPFTAFMKKGLMPAVEGGWIVWPSQEPEELLAVTEPETLMLVMENLAFFCRFCLPPGSVTEVSCRREGRGAVLFEAMPQSDTECESLSAKGAFLGWMCGRLLERCGSIRFSCGFMESGAGRFSVWYRVNT
jgi:hypothetical protein